jgi:hypothetical protein
MLRRRLRWLYAALLAVVFWGLFLALILGLSRLQAQFL